MSERIKTWLAWTVSVLLLAAGLWSYYSPVDQVAACEGSEARSVAIAVVIYAPFPTPGIDVYWLEAPSFRDPLLDIRSLPR